MSNPPSSSFMPSSMTQIGAATTNAMITNPRDAYENTYEYSQERTEYGTDSFDFLEGLTFEDFMDTEQIDGAMIGQVSDKNQETLMKSSSQAVPVMSLEIPSQQRCSPKWWDENVGAMGLPFEFEGDHRSRNILESAFQEPNEMALIEDQESNDEELSNDSQILLSSHQNQYSSTIHNAEYIDDPHSTFLLYDEEIHVDGIPALKIHMIDKVSQQKSYSFQCLRCSKVLSYITHLREHVRNHTGTEPYTCLYCGTGFKKIFNQQLHISRAPESCGRSLEKQERMKNTLKKIGHWQTPIILTDVSRYFQSNQGQNSIGALSSSQVFNIHRDPTNIPLSTDNSQQDSSTVRTPAANVIENEFYCCHYFDILALCLTKPILCLVFSIGIYESYLFHNHLLTLVLRYEAFQVQETSMKTSRHDIETCFI
eukprot:403353693